MPKPAEDYELTESLHVKPGKGDPFAAAIRATRMPMIITDPRQADNPIVFANQAFLDLTGYRREEVMGRNCRFLQGPGTSQDAIGRLREAIHEAHDVCIDILNYRKDGSSFWNALYISPVRSESGELMYFFASQLNVTERVFAHNQVQDDKNHFAHEVRNRTQELELALSDLRQALAAKTDLLHELDHRVKNNLQMLLSIITMQAREIPDFEQRKPLLTLSSRVEALSAVHRHLYQADDVSRLDMGDFLKDLINEQVSGSARRNLRAEFDFEPVDFAASKATALALIANEMVSALVSRSPQSKAPAVVRASLRSSPETITLDMVLDAEQGPVEWSEEAITTGLVKALARQLGAKISCPDEARHRILLDVPLGSVAERGRTHG